MKQSDITIAVNLKNTIEKMENHIRLLTDKDRKQEISIGLPIGQNNYTPRTKMLSTGIVETIELLIIADFESQIQFMKKKIENL